MSNHENLDLEGLKLLGLEEPIYVTNFINNTFSPKSDDHSKFLPITNPANGKILGYLQDSEEADVNEAVSQASKAQVSWENLPRSKRSEWLLKLSEAILSEKWFDKLALTESLDAGKTYQLCSSLDIPRAAWNLKYFSTLLMTWFPDSVVIGDEQKALHYTHRKPVGVSGLISPWNLPLYLLTWKLAPCLAAGCVAVCKPSEVTSLTAYFLAKIAQEIEFPPGAINMVFGTGAKAGQALVAHPDVPAISFTGGTSTGKIIATTCAPLFKKLSLELGGKNPSIILPDCDLDKAVGTSAMAAFGNQGQICLCMSRIYVHSSIYDEFVAKLVGFTKATFKLGPPHSPETSLGSLSSYQHFQKVISYVDLAREEGGKIECGGKRHSDTGAFLEPTIITGLDPNKSRLYKEEIFGPIVTVSKFEDEAEAIKLANQTNYGLAACVWGSDIQRTRRVAQSIRAGMVWVNCWMIRDINTPFGGLKDSGIGKEGGTNSLSFFTDVTNITLAD